MKAEETSEKTIKVMTENPFNYIFTYKSDLIPMQGDVITSEEGRDFEVLYRVIQVSKSNEVEVITKQVG